MVLHPSKYAELLADKVRKHNVDCWLVNTGWSGGPYGVGTRMSIKHTRALLKAALEGKLKEVPFERDPVFGLNVPASCEGVPGEVLNPKNTWSDPAAYDEKAKVLRSVRALDARHVVLGQYAAGEMDGVVSTSALEMGIDIGYLDICLLAGYPGTIASTWQQAGRAGRGLEPALSVLLVSADPLEQFLAHHPERKEKKSRTDRFGTFTHFEQDESASALYYVGLEEQRRYQHREKNQQYAKKGCQRSPAGKL